MKFLGFFVLLTSSLLASEPSKKLGFCFQAYVRSCEMLDNNQVGQCYYDMQVKRVIKALDEDGILRSQIEMQYEDITYTYDFIYNAKLEYVKTFIFTQNDRIKPLGFDHATSNVNIKKIEELRYYETLGGLVLSESGDMIITPYTSISYIPEDQPEFCTLGIAKREIPLN